MMSHRVDENAVIQTSLIEAIQKSPLVVKEILVVLEYFLFRNRPEEKRAPFPCTRPTKPRRVMIPLIPS